MKNILLFFWRFSGGPEAKTWADKCSHPLQRELSIMSVQDLLREPPSPVTLHKSI